MASRTRLLSMLIVATVFSQGLSLPCSPLPYEIYWNVADQNPRGIDVAAFNIFPANYTQTGDACSNPGCKRWTQGVFPTISDSGTKVNGGVPQNANLSQHLEALSRDVVHWIPDPDWSGNAVLDFEDWTTVWELNTGGGDWHSRRYPKYSLELEAEQHPDWDVLEVYLQARKHFNISALDFFAETLKTLTDLRPRAKWGFYGLPMNFNEPCEGFGLSMKCGYDSIVGPIYRDLSDQQRLVWAASSALFPSIYLPPGRTVDENAAYVRSVIKEAVRNAAGRIPVYGFHWNYYHDGKSLLNMEDLRSGLLGPYDMGAQGVVIWGSSAEADRQDFLTVQ
jgi:hyaluronoglucosaminidase